MGHEQNAALGRLGVVGIWLTAGLALPLVNYLRAFSPEQLMTLRGFMTACIALAMLRSFPWKVDRNTHLMALVLPFATLGLFEGIRAWGVGPTIIILTATPLVNLALSPFFGRKISRASVIGFLLVLGGVVMARWGGEFHWSGFAWSVFATVMNGILYELFAGAKADPLQKCIWGSLGMGLLGLVLSFRSNWSAVTDPSHLLLLVGFGFVGGFLYWIANLTTFKNLPINEASVLAQGEAPAVIIGACLLLGEQLTLLQWVGVLTALTGAAYLSYWINETERRKATAAGEEK